MKLLHGAITDAKPWTKERRLSYLMNAHRLDVETSGVILLAKSKPVLVELANAFGSEKPVKTYLALVRDAPEKDEFEVEAKLAPHPLKMGLTRVDQRHGKRARTVFQVRERFAGWTLLTCQPLTGRAHQIRAHLRHVRLPIVGDSDYGGKPLWLSRLKHDYHLKRGEEERPLMACPALHAEQLSLAHPVTGEALTITAPWPKDLTVALKYLRRFAPPA
jgi:RluA family pseudouridine synthase